MQKKILLQLFLLLTIILISVVFFKTYFTKKNTNNIKNNNKLLKEKESNLIHNLEYISKDKTGKTYIITSKIGEVSENSPEVILMKHVTATINFNNSSQVIIYADNAIYNKFNYDTNFYENVLVTYEDHTITSNNLDFLFEKNLATVSNDIIYKNLNIKLQADKVEIDLITKNSKIFMYDKSDKINIVSMN